ncbi:MAG TPA: cupin domain-containing protein [Bryobacteraceae bacterium]|nr:cupin domain-containing protein [Bryobacteraceae bacterium]
MRQRVMWVLLFSAVTVVTVLYFARNVWATPANGFAATTLALGRFGEIDVFNQLPQDGNVWLSLQKTKAASDLYVQSNVWQPGGSTGWHTHPGHSLIIVTAGAVTAYEGNDRDCKPSVYTQGMGFVDPGGDHVHILRNEGIVEARTIAVQLIPAGAVRRFDAQSPGYCPF